MSLVRSWCWVLAVGLFASTAAGREAGAGTDDAELTLAALRMQKKEPHAALWEATVAARRKGAAFRDWAGWVLTGR